MPNKNCSFHLTVLSLFLGVTFFNAPDRGGTITITPDPIVLGGAATYKANGPFLEGYPRHFGWEYRQNDVCVTAWGPLSSGAGSQTMVVYELYPGKFDIRCTVSYDAYRGGDGVFHPAPPSEVIQTQMTVPPPSGSRILARAPGGLNVNGDATIGENPGIGVLIKFQVTCSSGDCQDYMCNMTPVEIITNQNIRGQLQPKSAAGPSNNFTLVKTVLKDQKRLAFNQAD